MKDIIAAFATELDGIVTLIHPEGEKGDYPYATYEYASASFYNQYNILFSLDIHTNTATEAETIATEARKALHDYQANTAETTFRVTHSPEPIVVPTQGIGKNRRRLNFTVIAYFKED